MSYISVRGEQSTTAEITLLAALNALPVDGASAIVKTGAATFGQVSIGAGTGDVVGPASSTDNALVRFDSTTGKLIKDSVVILTATVLSPSVSDGVALGSGTLMWSDLYLASGGVIRFNNTDVLITHGPNQLDFSGAAGAANGYTFDNVIRPDANDGAPLGTSTVSWSDLFLASGAVVNFNNGNMTLTHAAGSLTFAGGNVLGLGAATATSLNGLIVSTTTGTFTLTNAKTFSVTNTLTLSGTDSTVMTFPTTSATIARTDAANTFTGASTANAWVLTSPTITTSIVPTANDGAALGSGTNQFSDLFLASGGVINWANGDVTETHSSNLLAWAGATGGYTFDGLLVVGGTASLSVGGAAYNNQIQGTTAATSGMALLAHSATAGVAADIAFYRSKNAAIGSATVVASGDRLGSITWYGAQQTGTFATQNTAAQIRAEVDGTVTSGAGADMPGRIIFATTADGSGTLTDRLILDAAGILKPNANDGVALGTATLSFADLFLASGAVINFNNGDVLVTHSADTLTFTGATAYVYDAVNRPSSNDGAALGSATVSWSDLFLASGGVINFGNGEVTLTAAANSLTLAGGEFSFGANTAYFTETDNGNSSTADTIDWKLSNKQRSTLTGNCTFTFTAPSGPCSLVLKLIQDGTGSRTVTWPAAVHWSGGVAPTLTTTASRVDVITFYYDGTTYFGNYSLNYVA